MLISKDAIADVTEVLRGPDFYRPSHETIHDAIIDLFGRGEPVDMVTVAAELQRRGELQRIGGAPYLHTLSANVPIAANASYYAEIVREKAILRRLVDAGTKIVQIGYAGEGHVDDVVDRAQAEIYQITDRRSSEDYAPLSDIMDGVLDEIEAISNREAGLYGVPTGFADLDDLTNGLHSGQMIIVAARPAMGKALALDTPLPTPTGWTTMGEVSPGDQLIDADGRPTTVVAATEVMHGRRCYEVEFSDGSRIIADAEHQWLTETRAARKSTWAADRQYNRTRNQRIFASVVTTEEIARTRTVGADDRANHAVLNSKALVGEEAVLPVPPYALGAWLGDGHSASSRITCETNEIPMYLEGAGLRIEHRGDMLYSIKLADTADGPDVPGRCADCGGPSSGRTCRECRADHGSFAALLRKIGVLNNKHIPTSYLRASEQQRRELLAGLMDTDGTVVRGVGSCQFAVTNARLAQDVYELVVSLGYKCGRRTKQVQGRSPESSTCYVLNFSTTDDVFRLERKHLLHKEERPATTTRIGRRYITAVREVDSVPVRCVQVDNEDHLYLAGESMIPTHNSTLALDFCRAASIQNNLTSAFFSLEMTRSEITMRLLSAEAKVPLNHIRNGAMNDDDWAKLARKMGEVSSAPIFIDDSPNMTMMEIRAKARRLKQRHDLKLMVIDYLQLMTSGRKVESRQLEVSEFSRQIKLLAKELEIPIIALSQLNRGPEQRGDKRPMMSDLRESGCLTAETRLLRADNNAEVTLGELLTTGACDVPVWALDERLKLVPRTLTHAFPSGTKQTYRVTLGSGRTVEATGNHPFLTYDGWVPLAELTVGSRVGSVRHVPPPLQITPRDADEVVLLAHLLGDGSFVRRQPIRYASVDEANLDAVAEAAHRRFGITAVRDEYAAARVTTLRLPAPYRLARGRRNPIAAWLDEDGLFGLRSHEKFVPDWVFGLPKEQVGLFLRHLWATDGCVHLDEKRGMGRVYYASTSRRLADDVARLLARYNVFTRIKRARKNGYRDGWHVHVVGAENQLRFLEDIGVHGARAAQVERLAAHLRGVRPNTNLDTVPTEVWGRVREVLADQGMTQREFAAAMGTSYGGSSMWKAAPSRQRMARVADVLGNADLEVLATNDIYWDSVASIEPCGEQEVYDATVLGVHNFVANGIALHNSIEQDADMVVLLHRDDVYEKESTRPGEADLIVAKHRNGPTRDITVAFQGHYSRFVDMAH
ncbi:replicative DNA helicase [Nocardioides sp. SYSU DS0663]|uniref:replicative DNA helicase n=1 Tax=Nocardioides sp. SYSU DS0663 TaxID=3416445 RepID=UPI003F4B5D9E